MFLLPDYIVSLFPGERVRLRAPVTSLRSLAYSMAMDAWSRFMLRGALNDKGERQTGAACTGRKPPDLT